MKHQLSYTATLVNVDDETGPGDALLNYRYQLFEEGPGRPAMSPRVSLVIPSATRSADSGRGGWGLQFNLPVSKQVGDFYLHGNAGVTWWPSLSTDQFPVDGLRAGARTSRVASPFRRRQRHLPRAADVQPDARERRRLARGRRRGRARPIATPAFIISPGARGGWNIGDKQIVVGLAVPVFRFQGDTFTGVFGYFSYELPF